MRPKAVSGGNEGRIEEDDEDEEGDE